MYKLALIFMLCAAQLLSQNDSLQLNTGDKAPAFALSLKDNSMRSFAFPYMKRLVLVHFWNGDAASRMATRQLKSIAERYRNNMFKTADNFEVVAIAVKTDKMIWKEMLWTDSLTVFTNGLVKDYTEDVCKKYNVTAAPRDLLIDENGIIVAINPKMKELETILAERKVFQPVKKDLTGLLAKSLNRDEVLKSGKLSLYTIYGDSISSAACSSNGRFNFSYIKLNQDLVLKIADQSEMDPADPIALYGANGDFLMNGFVSGNSCEFYIPYKMVYRLLDAKLAVTPNEQMNLVSNLEFTSTGMFQLSPKDEQDLNALADILLKNKTLSVEFKTHTDTRQSESTAMDVTTRQMQLIKNYFQKKGIAASRIKGIPKGKSAPSKPCDPAKCTEEEHRQNRRVEFLIS